MPGGTGEPINQSVAKKLPHFNAQLIQHLRIGYMRQHNVTQGNVTLTTCDVLAMSASRDCGRCCDCAAAAAAAAAVRCPVRLGLLFFPPSIYFFFFFFCCVRACDAGSVAEHFLFFFSPSVRLGVLSKRSYIRKQEVAAFVFIC